MSSSEKVITQTVVLSFPHLDEPTVAMNKKGDPKYSASLLYLPGTDLTAEKAAVLKVAVERYGQDKAATMLKSGALLSPFRTDWEVKGYPEGTTFINVRSIAQPGMVYAWPDPKTGKAALVIPGLALADYELTDADKKLIRKVFYAGAKVRASISAFVYEYREDANGPVLKRGVSFGLNNVQKIGDGPRMDGRKAADDEFEATQELAPTSLEDLED